MGTITWIDAMGNVADQVSGPNIPDETKYLDDRLPVNEDMPLPQARPADFDARYLYPLLPQPRPTDFNAEPPLAGSSGPFGTPDLEMYGESGVGPREPSILPDMASVAQQPNQTPGSPASLFAAGIQALSDTNILGNIAQGIRQQGGFIGGLVDAQALTANRLALARRQKTAEKHADAALLNALKPNKPAKPSDFDKKIERLEMLRDQGKITPEQFREAELSLLQSRPLVDLGDQKEKLVFEAKIDAGKAQIKSLTDRFVGINKKIGEAELMATNLQNVLAAGDDFTTLTPFLTDLASGISEAFPGLAKQILSPDKVARNQAISALQNKAAIAIHADIGGVMSDKDPILYRKMVAGLDKSVESSITLNNLARAELRWLSNLRNFTERWHSDPANAELIPGGPEFKKALSTWREQNRAFYDARRLSDEQFESALRKGTLREGMMYLDNDGKVYEVLPEDVAEARAKAQ